MNTNALVVAPNATLPTPQEWSLLRDMAETFIPTGFLPDSIKKPEQALLIMLKGRELGVPSLYALSNIAVVKGKPTVSAEMMLALIYRDHGKRAIRVKESTNDHCTIEYRLPGWDVSSYTFTMDDASNAGLDRNPTWKQYPAAMLRARCISAVARMAFPESIAGMYVPGELGDAVEVTEDGEVRSVTTVPTAEAVIVDPNSGEIVDRNPTPIRNAPVERSAPPQRTQSHRSSEDRRIGIVDRLGSLVSAEALEVWAQREHNVDDPAEAPVNALSALYNRLAKDLDAAADFDADFTGAPAQAELVTAEAASDPDRFTR